MSYPAAYPDWFKNLVATIVLMGFAWLVVQVLTMLAGCATWEHPLKTDQDFNRDLYECEVQAAPVVDPMRAMLMKQNCMRLKGWR